GGHDCQHVKDGDIEVLGHNAIAEGQGQKGKISPAESDVGPRPEEPMVRQVRDDIFLDEELQTIRERLQPAKLATDARGAKPILNPRRNLSLQPYEEDGR